MQHYLVFLFTLLSGKVEVGTFRDISLFSRFPVFSVLLSGGKVQLSTPPAEICQSQG